MRTHHLRQRFDLRDAQRALARAVLRKERPHMFDEPVKGERELADLVAAPDVDLHGEIVLMPHAAHCGCERMQRLPESAAQAVGQIRRDTEGNGVHDDDETEQIVERCRIIVLSQVDLKRGLLRRMHIVAHGGVRRLLRLA